MLSEGNEMEKNNMGRPSWKRQRTYNQMKIKKGVKKKQQIIDKHILTEKNKSFTAEIREPSSYVCIFILIALRWVCYVWFKSDETQKYYYILAVHCGIIANR